MARRPPLLRALFGGGRPRWDGRGGKPRSANGASSSHLRWRPGVEAPAAGWTAAEVTLTVLDAPRVPALYFWALQASFVDRGRRFGGAHLGLQWHPRHPGSTAVNWGGYHSGGGELEGSESLLPSATANPNTRDFDWQPGVAYRLRIEAVLDDHGNASGDWRALVGPAGDEVTGGASEGAALVAVRDLHAGGAELGELMVWSEVFADCDAPETAVAWSSPVLEDRTGARVPVEQMQISYQSLADGGCALGDTDIDHLTASFVQRTGVERQQRHGAVLRLT